MAKLHLKQNIVTFQGRPIIDDATNQPVILKDMLLQYLGTFTSQDGQQLIRASILGQKIYQTQTDDVEIEEKDLLLIQQAIEKPQHVAVVYGQLASIVNKALNSYGNEKVVGLKQTAKS